MNKSTILLGSLVASMSLGSVAPLVGEDNYYKIDSTSTQNNSVELKDIFVGDPNVYNDIKNVLAEHIVSLDIDIVTQTDKSIKIARQERIINEIIEKEKKSKKKEEKRLQKIKEKMYTEMCTPQNNSFKGYMDYTCITSKNTPHWRMQNQYAYTDPSTGIRMVDDRYCVAVGSGYATQIGTKIDLVMYNGSIIKCILADCKSDAHTDAATHRYNQNGCIAEFIVQTSAMDSNVRSSGDLSNISKIWRGDIKTVRVYKNNKEY